MRKDITLKIDGKEIKKTIKSRGVMPKPKMVILSKKDKMKSRRNKEWKKQLEL